MDPHRYYHRYRQYSGCDVRTARPCAAGRAAKSNVSTTEARDPSAAPGDGGGGAICQIPFCPPPSATNRDRGSYGARVAMLPRGRGHQGGRRRQNPQSV